MAYTKILILAAGNIGAQIARILHDDIDYDITIADSNQAAIDAISNVIPHITFEVANDSVMESLIADFDVVINALPHTENMRIAKMAYDGNTNYFDLSEDVESTEYIKKLALNGSIQNGNSGIAFMPQCGLAPGFINILANSVASTFTEIHDVKMRVGALPVAPSNSLKYNFTWSVDGLINEYINDGKAIENGNIVSVKGMEGLEHIVIDGIEYEAFNTSGGAGSLIESLHGKARNVNYKTLRYTAHQAIMTTLLKDLKLENDRDTLKKVLVNAIPSTLNDVVVIYVSVTGMKNGKFVEENKSIKIYGDEDGTAIQKTTAGGICIAVDAFCHHELPQTGFLSQELITLEEFTNNKYSFLK